MKTILALLLFCLPAAAPAANLLINGDFESGAGGWSAWWGGDSAVGIDDPLENDHCGGVWWNGDGLYQQIAIGPERYTVRGEMLHLSGYPLGNGRIGLIRAEGLNGDTTVWSRDLAIDTDSPRDTWIARSMEIDNTTAGATELRLTLMLADLAGTGSGNVRYDNIVVAAEEAATVNSPNYNGDNTVNLADFATLAGAWAREDAGRNLDGENTIGLGDLAAFASAWLTTIPGYDGYELVWSDEFEGTALKTANWSYQIMGDGGNNEWQYYTNRPQNAWVSDGCLTIQANKETYYAEGRAYHYTSARLRTAGKQEFLYGRMEGRIQLPKGQGIWPAFWMMPAESVYGGWAASGEIDIMESINQAFSVYGTLHYGGSWPNNQNSGCPYGNGTDFSQGFHVYAIEWEPTEFRWYVDGHLYCTKTNWWSSGGDYPAPFNQPFYFILNVAVGGNWPGYPDETTTFPQRMVVDWVRVYQKTAP